MSDIITFSSSLVPGTARVIGFRGDEAISRPYRIEVYLSVPADAVEPDLIDAVGTKARLSIGSDAGTLPFLFAGILGGVDHLHEYDGYALLRAVLVPRLSELALSRHSRIFTQKSVPDVIKAVLAENGVTDFECNLGAYDVEEHICQYRESDLDFISRWMEREGIRYWFEHTEDGERLILADGSTYPEEPLGLPARYAPSFDGQEWGRGGELRSFAGRYVNLPSTMKVRDNDYVRPSLAIQGTAPVAANGSGEVNRHGERVFTPAAGQRLARLRSEEQLTRQAVFQATGARRHLHAGYAFEVDEHPRASFNTRYLVTEVHHYGNQAATGHPYFKKVLDLEQPDIYLADLSAILAKTQFRPACTTPWPRIYGVETALVDGPASSEYAQIDSSGRYNVKFQFDESSLEDGTASTWVRMTQPHGGGVEGFHFPLRKATEVVVSFLGGDPDRPVISGVVPNTLTPSPVTAGNHTKNVIQTGGRNRFELEDLAGQQRITLSTPHTNSYLRMGAPNDAHNVILHTDGHTLHDTGVNLDIEVGGTMTEGVVGAVTVTYENTFDTQVTGAVTETYLATKTETLTGALVETYNDTKQETVALALTENYNNTKNETVALAVTETYNSTKNETVTGLVTEVYKAGQTKTITGDKDETISGNYNVTVAGGTAFEVTGPASTTVHGPWGSILKSSNVNVTYGVTSNTFFGAANSNNFGINNSNFVGVTLTTKLSGDVNLTLGASFTAKLSADFSITGGASVSMKYGVALTANAALELTMRTAKVEEVDVRVAQLGLIIGNCGVALYQHGFTVLS